MTALQRYLTPELLRRLSALTLSARTVAAGTTTGRHRAPVRGSSIEFRQHRFYSSGDDPRRLDWRLLARTDRAYVREYEQETNLHCLLMLDASGSMTFGARGTQKLLYARRVAAGLAYVMLSQSEATGLASFAGSGAELSYLPPHAGRTQLARVIERLDRVVGGGRAAFAEACAVVANRLKRRALIVVVSDLLMDADELGRGLVRLRHDRHEVTLFRVVHRSERTFPFARWTRFVGTEGEGTRVAEPAVVRRVYLGRFEEHRQQISRVCRPLGIAVHECLTDSDLGDEVSRFIVSRGLSSVVRASAGVE